MITDTNKAAFDIILTFLFKEKIKLNEITRQFEQDGKPQSEQDINYHFISIKNDNPQSKGLTKQYFDLALNSSYIHTVNPLKDFFKDRKEMKQTGFIGKSTQIDPLRPKQTNPHWPFQIDPLIPA